MVTAGTRQSKTAHSGRKTRGGTQSCEVIPFPVFENYGDEIVDWLSALGHRKPSARTVARVVKSMRTAIVQLERVRKSGRHCNLASFLRHAADALEASEWDGARYVLKTASALMTARPSVT